MTDARRNYETTRDEFIQDYLDRHGHNQATRTEAEDLADEWRDVARDAVQFARLAVKRTGSAVFRRDAYVEQAAYEAFIAFDEACRFEPAPNMTLAALAIKLAMSEGE